MPTASAGSTRRDAVRRSWRAAVLFLLVAPFVFSPQASITAIEDGDQAPLLHVEYRTGATSAVHQQI